jgi:hypothetical protein
VKVAGWLRARARALAIGDAGLARSLTADLIRIGYREPSLETVSAPGMPEMTDPPKALPRNVQNASD